jgi:predicted NBD/HSP70 family sugar kinase
VLLTAIEKTLLPYFLPKYPDHELQQVDIGKAAKLVRGLADKGDPMCREIFRVQAHGLGLFFDEMINTFDPDALIVGEALSRPLPIFSDGSRGRIRAGMPVQREEQSDIPIHIMPNGDTAGARGAAIEAMKRMIL